MSRCVSRLRLAAFGLLSACAFCAHAQSPPEGGVCDRTPQVRDALVAAAGVSDCAAVTDTLLAAVENLELVEQGVMSLQPGDFSGLSGMTVLVIESNPLLRALPEDLFAGLNGLQVLEMGENALAELPSGVFAGFGSLETLWLSGNELTELPSGVFAGLGSLGTLGLSENELTELPPGVFAELVNLQNLQLDGNALIELPPGVFAGLANLQTLRLDGNALTGLPPRVFAGLANLLSLFLLENALTELPPGVFAGLGKLLHLQVYRNELTELPPGVFAGLGQLRQVGFGGNRPGGVEGGVFRLPLRFELVASSPVDSPDSATVRATLRAGAPYPLSATLVAHNARSSSNRVMFAAGSTQTKTFSVTRDSAATTFGMSFANVSPLPTGTGIDLAGFEVDSSARLILGEALPTLTGVRIVSSPTGDAYVGGSGEEIVVEVGFSGAVDVIAAEDGSRPTLTLQIGEEMRSAVCSRAVTTPTSLVCRYAPEIADEGRVGIVENSLSLNDAQVLSNGVALPALPPFDAVADAGQSVEKGRVRLSFADAPVSAAEGSTLEVTFHVVPAAVKTLTVRYDVFLGGAEERAYADAGDFPGRAVPAGTVEVAVGSSSGVIRIATEDDDELEPAREYFSVRLLDGEGYVVEPQRSTAMAAILRDGICDRTPKVRDALVTKIGVSDCAAVTAEQLAAVSQLALEDQRAASVKSGDFSGLSALLFLDLDGNRFRVLPEDVFAGLANLQHLDLGQNRLVELPPGVFAGLGSLINLRLNGNGLTGLPPGVFAGLASLKRLWLYNNALSELPPGVFSGLGSLVELNLTSNRPGGVEGGVFGLRLRFELVSSSPTDLSGPAPDSAVVRATLRVGAPYELFADLVSHNARSSSSTLVLEAGSTQTGTFVVTRDSGATTFGMSFANVTPPPTSGGNFFVGFEIDSGARLILGEAPTTLVGVRIASSPMGDAYAGGSGEEIVVEFEFSGAVDVIPARDGSRPTLALQIGEETRSAACSEVVSSPTRLVCRYAPEFTDEGRIGIAENSLSLNGARLLSFGVALPDPPAFDAVADAGQSVERGRVRLSFAAASFSAAEGSALEATFDVVPAAVTTLTVRYDVLLGGAEERAYADAADFAGGVVSGGAVEIPVGASRGVIRVPTGDDDEIEPAREYFSVRLLPGEDYLVEPQRSTAMAAINEGVCDRTAQVRDALVAAADVSDCAAVTDTLLAAVEVLNLEEQEIESLQPGDFSGLSSLVSLNLPENRLRALPEEVFAGLAKLQLLWLDGNELTALPPGVFAGLTDLRVVDLGRNALTELPPGVFSGLGGLTDLRLNQNALTELPPGVFSELANLQLVDLGRNALTELPPGVFAGLADLGTLNLSGNELTELPPGVFAGLGRLTLVGFGGNRPGGVEGGVFRLPLRFELVSSSPTDLSGSGPASATVRVTLRAGAPWRLSADLVSHNARSSSNTLMLAAGSTQAGTFVVTRDSGATTFGMSFANVTPPPFGFAGFEIDPGARLILGEALPTLTGVRIASSPVEDAYVGGSGEEIVVEFEFSRAVDVIVAQDGSRPTLTLQIGEAARSAVCSRAVTTPTSLVCRYAPEFSDEGRIGIVGDSLRLNGAQLLSNGVALPGAPAFDAVADAGQSVERGRVRLSFAGAPFSAGEGSTLEATFDVVPAAVTTLTVHYDVFLGGVEGRAYADVDDFPVDFAEGVSAGTVEVAVGAARGVIRIPVGDDDEIEPVREYFSVRLLDGEDYVVEPQRSTAAAAINEGVCDRTAQVRDALVSATGQDDGVPDCAGVTGAQLAAVSELTLASSGVVSLKPKDFSGLTNLLVLDLNENALVELPPGVFAGLENLQSLWLGGNMLGELPPEVFSGLVGLLNLELSGNDLSELPAGIFTGLTNLRSLDLSGNRPGGVEDGIFRLELQFELAEVSSPRRSATARAALRHGAPWRLAAMIEAHNAGLSTDTLAISAGSTRSATFTVTRDSTASTFGAAFASVSPPPAGEFCSRAAGEACFVGLEIDTSARLVLGEAPLVVLGVRISSPATVVGAEIVIEIEFDGDLNQLGGGVRPTLTLRIGDNTRTATCSVAPASASSLECGYVLQASDVGRVGVPANPLSFHGALPQAPAFGPLDLGLNIEPEPEPEDGVRMRIRLFLEGALCPDPEEVDVLPPGCEPEDGGEDGGPA